MAVKLMGNYEQVLREALGTKLKSTAEIGFKDAAVATYASYNEFGWVQSVTARQARFLGAKYGVNLKPGNSLILPPRPFMRGTLNAKRDEWLERFRGYAQQTGLNRLDQALALIAEEAANDVKMTILNGGVEGQPPFPKRSPITMAILSAESAYTAKGRRRKMDGTGNVSTDQPLKNTGVMLSKVGYWLK